MRSGSGRWRRGSARTEDAIRRLFAGFVLAALAVTLAACGGDEPDPEETSWLLVISGEVASVADGTMAIAADGPAIAFSDRPERLVRFVALDEIAAAWADGGAFAGSPPNASLVDETNRALGIVELQGLTVTSAVLTFTFSDLEGDAPAVGDIIALTIDAFPTAVNNQITD